MRVFLKEGFEDWIFQSSSLLYLLSSFLCCFSRTNSIVAIKRKARGASVPIVPSAWKRLTIVAAGSSTDPPWFRHGNALSWSGYKRFDVSRTIDTVPCSTIERFTHELRAMGRHGSWFPPETNWPRGMDRRNRGRTSWPETGP